MPTPAALLALALAAIPATALAPAPAPGGAAAAARRALARGDLTAADRDVAALPPDAPERPELAWLAARASGAPARIAAAAAAWCGRDPTGRACADAELYRNAPRMRARLASSEDVPLSTTAPFPLTIVRAGDRKTGAILDTGASETVVSTRLARALGLRTTARTFPVATPAGTAAARLAILPALSVPGFAARDVPVLVMDLGALDAVGVSMIVSPQQVFDGLTVRLDLGRHVMRVGHERLAAGHGAGGAIVVPYLQAGFDLAVEARVGDGPRALFGVDTGMQGGYVVAAAYAPAPISGETVVRAAGTEAVTASTTARPVTIGATALAPTGACLVVPLPATGPLALSGMLGNGLWRGRTITLDTVSRLLRIGAEAPPPPRT